MSIPASLPVRIAAADCVTALGETDATLAALLDGKRGLQPVPVLGEDGGDAVPLALFPGRPLDEQTAPRWAPVVQQLVEPLRDDGWGGPRRPVFFTSSNFGVASLHAYRRTGDAGHLVYGSPFRSVDWLRRSFGWGDNVSVFSHACVSAHLGLLHASRLVAAGAIERALVFSYDMLSPFVAGGFHALKILNAGFPAPYAVCESGSIGLGDGAAYAVLTRDEGDFVLEAQSIHNEMHHFTANEPTGAGFSACLAPLARVAAGRRVWLKGHGTGTLEAGRLEAEAMRRNFPGAPLVGWKGSLGHTLGSCGLVELALVMAAWQTGRAPGTIASARPTVIDEVALEPFRTDGFDAVICASNAFGGAHAALLMGHV